MRFQNRPSGGEALIDCYVQDFRYEEFPLVIFPQTQVGKRLVWCLAEMNADFC